MVLVYSLVAFILDMKGYMRMHVRIYHVVSIVAFQVTLENIIFKGSSDQSHFIFEINVRKRRIRHITTLKLNEKFLD